MHGLLSIDVQHKIMQVPSWIYPRGVGPTQIVEGHNVFSTKWTGLATGISTKWGEQRIHYIKWIALASWNSWVLLRSAPQLSQWQLPSSPNHREIPWQPRYQLHFSNRRKDPKISPKSRQRSMSVLCIDYYKWHVQRSGPGSFSKIAGWKKLVQNQKTYPSIPRKTTHTFRIHTFWMKIPSLSWRNLSLGFSDAIYQDLPSGDGI